jgi:protein-L-isoaspartate O-methyltransferase
MDPDLAATRDDVPERFVPDEMRGELIEAEHLARYEWAASIAAGRRALDAGCGTAYGTAMLAAASAHSATGVDIAGGVLEAVRADVPDAVRLDVGDVRDLPYEDASFDLVVCFEVIEHVAEQDAALGELARVIAPSGVLLISSPSSDELARALGERFGNVRLLRQHSYLASAILTDEQFQAGDGGVLPGVPVRKQVGGELGSERFTLAIAGNGELPEMPESATLTSDLQLRHYFEVVDGQGAVIQDLRARIDELDGRLAAQQETAERLMTAEADLARLPELEMHLDRARGVIEQRDVDLRETQSRLQEVLGSSSWRLTRPLRAAMRVLGSRR